MNNTLYLTISREPFEAIASGRKKIEYREDKPYWVSRLSGKSFTKIVFRNGYSRTSPTLTVELLSIYRARGRFNLYLGDIISRT